MEEGADAMYGAVINLPSINMISVWTIASEKNVLFLVVVKILWVELIDAVGMVELEYVMNQIVTNLLRVRHINAEVTEEVTDVRIVLTGLIQGVVHLITMDIARLASNTCSQMTRAARKVICQRN